MEGVLHYFWEWGVHVNFDIGTLKQSHLVMARWGDRSPSWSIFRERL
jgi:hypothetical protein